MNEIPTILAVDDERLHLNVIAELLNDDYKVIVAKSGSKALELAISSSPPDLILLDVLMPEMDGYEVCKRLKENELTRDIPVIFLTVKSDISDETYGFSLGAVDYIAKPFSPPIVRARVHTHLLLRRALLDLANRNEHLEVKVAERAEQIRLAHENSKRLQIQLQQAHKMASIGLFTGGIAHDFNNILAVIIGFADLAQHSAALAGDRELQGYLSKISSAGEKARNLIEQLLAFSRGVPATGTQVNLGSVIEDAVSLLQPLLPASILLHTELRESLPAVVTDRVQMYQAVMNLCINARDAMAGNGEIRINAQLSRGIESVCSACGEAIHGDFVELVVADEGSGINPKFVDNIFKSLFSTKEDGKGTGMGLAVVNNIMHSHQGHILMESRVDKGTTFRLLFPPAPFATDESDLNDDSAKGTGLLTTTHIAVVCNDHSLAFLFKEHLENGGHRVTVHNRADEVHAAISAQSDNFNLLITDHLLPDLDGLALARQIGEQFSGLPVIICSSSPLLDSELGSAHFLARPFESVELLAAVDRLIQPKKRLL